MKTKILLFLCWLSFMPAVQAAGEVLKLDTTGVQYCSGLKPMKFYPFNDRDLWVKLNSDSTATLYGDKDLTFQIGTLDLETAVVNGRKVAFSGFAGDTLNHLVVIGTLQLDARGLAKTLKATSMRRGVFDSCFSRANITGKRVN